MTALLVAVLAVPAPPVQDDPAPPWSRALELTRSSAQAAAKPCVLILGIDARAL